MATAMVNATAAPAGLVSSPTASSKAATDSASAAAAANAAGVGNPKLATTLTKPHFCAERRYAAALTSLALPWSRKRPNPMPSLSANKPESTSLVRHRELMVKITLNLPIHDSVRSVYRQQGVFSQMSTRRMSRWRGRNLLDCRVVDKRRITVERSLALVPVRINGRCPAHRVQPGNLLRGEVPPGCAQILSQLCLIASANDHRRDGGPLQQPVERDLRYRLAGLSRHLIQRVHDPV